MSTSLKRTGMSLMILLTLIGGLSVSLTVLADDKGDDQNIFRNWTFDSSAEGWICTGGNWADGQDRCKFGEYFPDLNDGNPQGCLVLDACSMPGRGNVNAYIDIELPPDVNNISFDERAGSSGGLKFMLRDDGGKLHTFYDECKSGDTWETHSYDIGKYAGQRVRLQFSSYPAACGNCPHCGGTCNGEHRFIDNIKIMALPMDLEILDQNITFDIHEKTVKISARVFNRGDKDVSNVLVRVYLGDPERGGKKIGEKRIPSIVVNSSEKTGITWDVSKSTDIYVVVDPDNEIVESDEDNNIAFKRLDVEGPDYLLYFIIGAIVVICILGMVVLFAIYKALTYKKPPGENMECPRCGMVLPTGTKKCPVCGGEIK